MADNLKGIPFSTPDEGVDYPTKAKLIVQQQTRWYNIDYHRQEMVPLDDIYVVWFAYVLGGWKALVSTAVPDGKYYEVTHHPDRGTFLDTYVKVDNKEIPNV